MKKDHYKPYGLDIKYEFETYKFVGRDYGDRKTANLGLIGNIRRFIRKNKNKDEKKYAFCDTYSEWKKHVKEILPKETSCNYNDFIHWLYKERKFESDMVEITKVIMIPAYITFLSVSNYVKAVLDNILGYKILLFVVTVICISLLQENMDKLKFYDDFITLVEKNEL